MTLRSKWPGHSSAEIQIEFSGQRAILSSTRLFLDLHLPFAFDETRGRAKFAKDTETLEVSLPRAAIN